MRRAGLLAGALLVGACSNEPSHDGKSLSERTRQVQDLDSKGAVEAAEALAAMGREAEGALPALFFALQNGDAGVRTAAYEAVDAEIEPITRQSGTTAVTALIAAGAALVWRVDRT